MLGNALGGGRPAWVESSAPLTCTQGSHAPVCVGLASVGITYSPSGKPIRTYNLPTALFIVLAAGALGAIVATVSTYVSITGQLPPLVAQVCKLFDFIPFKGYTAAPSAPMERKGDWTWANPPREPTKAATAAPPQRNYGSV